MKLKKTAKGMNPRIKYKKEHPGMNLSKQKRDEPIK